MAVDYSGFKFAKRNKGQAVLDREKDDRERKATEERIAKAVKERDGRCRWPEAHKCRGQLEAAHIRDKSLCGPTETANEIALCRWLHRAGPESIHGKELKVECETERGADGPVSFWRQTNEYDALGQPKYYLVAREIQRGVIERD